MGFGTGFGLGYILGSSSSDGSDQQVTLNAAPPLPLPSISEILHSYIHLIMYLAPLCLVFMVIGFVLRRFIKNFM